MTSPVPFPDGFLFRKAVPDDIPNIYDLISDYAREGLLLPRTKDDLMQRIGNFHIAEICGSFVGCTALRNYGNHLYEVRSLAIRREFRGQHLGSVMVRALLEKLAVQNEEACVFALTYRETFFRRLGFQLADKKQFPEKIWTDCCICPKKDCCDEIAVAIHLPAEPDQPRSC